MQNGTHGEHGPPEQHKTVVRKTNGMAKVVGVAGIGTDQEVAVVTMTWWQIVLVRCARVYVASLLGLLGADASGVIDIRVPFTDLGAFASTAIAAIGPSVFALLQNLLEFLTAIDVKRPGWRA